MKALLVSLGCDKNRVDSERMMGLLYAEGCTETNDASEADIIIVNTCGFIREAVTESIETILTLAEYKKKGQCKTLVVIGCMVQRYRDEVMREIPEADAVLGVDAYETLAAFVRKLKGTKAGMRMEALAPMLPRRPVDGLIHTAYVKIAEGCDNRCAYCAIPSIRGPYRSRLMDDILSECEYLIKQGARELTLIAQDTALYGVDLYHEPSLPALLNDIAVLNGLTWVRVMYAYPEHISPGIIQSVAKHPRICRYLDMPIQHCDNQILRQMGRKSTNASLRRTIRALREAIPDISLRTTLMVGFPGETQEAFDTLRSFVGEIRFDRLGVFPYSREEGTPAAKMKRQVKKDVKQERRDMIMTLQQQIHEEKQAALRGQTITVITDGFADGGGMNANGMHMPNADGLFSYTGRSYRDAYEVDSIVSFTASKRLVPGEMARIRVTGSDEYDLYGEINDETGGVNDEPAE